MVISGWFAVIGLIGLAIHLARPDLLRRLVHADTRLWWFMPWVSEEILDPDGTYQRLQRRLAITATVGWTIANLALFILAYRVPSLLG